MRSAGLVREQICMELTPSRCLVPRTCPEACPTHTWKSPHDHLQLVGDVGRQLGARLFGAARHRRRGRVHLGAQFARAGGQNVHGLYLTLQEGILARPIVAGRDPRPPVQGEGTEFRHCKQLSNVNGPVLCIIIKQARTGSDVDGRPTGAHFPGGAVISGKVLNTTVKLNCSRSRSRPGSTVMICHGHVLVTHMYARTHARTHARAR